MTTHWCRVLSGRFDGPGCGCVYGYCRLQPPLPFPVTPTVPRPENRAAVLEVEGSQGEGTERVVLGFRRCEDCTSHLCDDVMLCRREVMKCQS